MEAQDRILTILLKIGMHFCTDKCGKIVCKAYNTARGVSEELAPRVADQTRLLFMWIRARYIYESSERCLRHSPSLFPYRSALWSNLRSLCALFGVFIFTTAGRPGRFLISAFSASLLFRLIRSDSFVLLCIFPSGPRRIDTEDRGLLLIYGFQEFEILWVD